jgi:hypothetical protein
MDGAVVNLENSGTRCTIPHNTHGSTLSFISPYSSYPVPPRVYQHSRIEPNRPESCHRKDQVTDLSAGSFTQIEHSLMISKHVISRPCRTMGWSGPVAKLRPRCGAGNQDIRLGRQITAWSVGCRPNDVGDGTCAQRDLARSQQRRIPVDKVSSSIASVGVHFRVGGTERAAAVSVSASTVKKCTCMVSLRWVKT